MFYDKKNERYIILFVRHRNVCCRYMHAAIYESTWKDMKNKSKHDKLIYLDLSGTLKHLFREFISDTLKY